MEKIEDFFKLCKEGLDMKKIHRYTKKSAKTHNTKCIFSRANHSTQPQLKNSTTKALRKLKNQAH